MSTAETETFDFNYREIFEAQRRRDWEQHRLHQPVAEPSEESDDSRERAQCEWTVKSGWVARQCSRETGFNPWGISLCWQHQDDLVSHVLGLVRRGDIRVIQFDELIGALVAAESLVPENCAQIIRRQISKYAADALERILLGMLRDGQVDARGLSWVPAQIYSRIDELIDQRIQQKWGDE